MHIQSFHIDNFGVFSQVAVDGLSEGLTVFLGKNEAGKSTCLEFFRTILTGYPAARSKEAQGRNFAHIFPGRSGQAGGTLGLHLEDRGLIHVTRRPDKGRDNVVLSDAQGTMLESSLLDSILAGVTRDVYRNVFGFSLSELQVFESLKDEGVRHALYGASFGMGLRSPGAVLKELEGQMEKLFKVKGSAPFINEGLRNLERVQKEMQSLKGECAKYDGLSLTKQTLEEGLQLLRQQKAQCEEQRRQAERQLGVWKQWDEWRNVGNQLARLDAVEETFPEDGAGRIERAQLLRQEAARRVTMQKERCLKLEEKRDALVIDEKLLEKRTTLQWLSEHKSSFRQAQESLAPHAMQMQRVQQQLTQSLAELGPQWTCERIHGINRSLVARSVLERRAADIQSTEQSHAAAINHLAKANGAVVTARHAVELAQNTLDHLPVAEALVSDAVREDMRRQVSLMENSAAALHEKEQALSSFHKTFQRTLTPLSLRVAADVAQGDSVQALLPRLEALHDAQDVALDLAHKAQVARQSTQEMELLVATAQEREENARNRAERLRQHLHKSVSASRTHIDGRAKAVRQLRQLHSNYSMEKDRLAELAQRVEGSLPPEPVKSIFLMVLGAIIVALGLTALALPIYFGMDSVQITPRLVVPLSQWSAYLVVVAGAAFLAGGLPRSGPDRKRYEREMKEISERAHAMQMGLTHMEGQIQEQCVLAEITDADPITLDAVEMRLERDREKCATDERMQLEVEQLVAEHDETAEKLKLRKQELIATQQQEQRALLKWHDCLRAYEVENIPSPDAAATFFARVEAALVAQASAHNGEEEIRQLQATIEQCKEKLCAIDAVQQALHGNAQSRAMQAPLNLDAEAQDAGMEMSSSSAHRPPMAYEISELLAAVQAVLAVCREADDALAERLRATTAVQNCTYSLEMAEKAQEEMEEALRQSEKDLQEALRSWQRALEDMGMSADISPGMVRAVLECMDKCVQLETEVLGLQEEKERLELECESFVLPLCAILEHVQQPEPEPHGGGILYQEDWLREFDSLWQHMQASYEAQQSYKQWQEQLSTQEEELHEASTALHDAETTIAHLLQLAKLDNVEEFIRLSHVRTQRLELMRRRQDLEDALSLAAGEKDLEAFLDSFASQEKHECEAFLIQKEAELQALLVEEQDKMHEFASINATLHGLTHTDTLAKLRQEERDIQESLQEAGKTWAQYAVARQMLLQAKQRFERERQPQVIRMASDIFAKITQEKWKGLTASLEDNSLQVISPFGEPLAPTLLSRGTQEQLYLALRLAYIRNHAAHARALPVIMDDVLVNFDPERAERTAEALLSLSQSGKRHQILFFTCHPHMADMLQKNHAQSKRFMVENAQITPA